MPTQRVLKARTDDAAIQFINAQGRHSAKMLGLPEKEFDGTFDSAVLEEDTNAISEWLGIVKKYYTKNNVNRTTNVSDGSINAQLENANGYAQGWITFDSYRVLKMAQGEWSNMLENLYAQELGLNIDERYYTAEIFKPLKIQYMGPLKTDKLFVQAVHNCLLMPLVPSIIEGTDFDVINQNFIKHQIDYALVSSGSKMGTITKDGINHDKLYEDYSKKIPYKGDYAKNTIFLEYLLTFE